MNEQIRKFPPMFLIACTFFCLGAFIMLYTLCFSSQWHYFKGFLLIATGLIGFGTGEILNHPREHVSLGANSENERKRNYYRRRNTCGLGNLLVIIAFLLFFGGISSIIY